MSSFDRQLASYVALIEEDLPRYFKKPASAPYGEVLEAMQYSLLGGGKRIRGVLVLAFYHLFGEDVTPALPFAAAVEMIHAYSLIHDDLPCMDDDDLRRGKPSCHIAYGEATALLAGDGLLTLAFQTAASVRNLPADRVLAATRTLAALAGMHGMIAGQVLDIQGEDSQLTAQELDAINLRKTGALIRAAASIGSCLGGADAAVLSAADAYADNVGLGFQIMDDVLDVTSDAATLGKPVGSDKVNHKNTYAALYGVERCRQLVAELGREAKERLGSTGLDTAFLCGLADMLGGRKY